MKFLDYLAWIERLNESSKMSLRDEQTDEILSSESLSGGMLFEVNYPHTKTLYEKKRKFVVNVENFNVTIKNYLIKSTNNLLKRKFDAYIFHNEFFDDINKFYFRLLSPIRDSFYLMNLLGCSEDNSYSYKIDGIEVLISIETSDNKTYLVIDAHNKISFSEFKHLANSILFSLAYLNGNLIREEELFFQTLDLDWKKEVNFFYRKLNKSVKCYKPITSIPQEYSNFINENEYNFDSVKSNFTLEHFKNLVCLIKKNDSFFAGIRILLEVFNNSFIGRSSILYVCLEIFTDEILKTKSIIHSDKNKMKQISIDILKKYEKSISIEDYDILMSSLGEIDKKLSQNNKKYESAFKNLDIDLSVEDRKCLNKRNKYFHGRVLPFDKIISNEEDYVNLELEYHYLSQRIFTLISKLILKYIGYTGYIVNHPKLREDQIGLSLNEEYFIKI